MANRPELIVMLTHNDVTVINAKEIFEECKNSKAKFWGFKEVGLSLEEMRDLFSYMSSGNDQLSGRNPVIFRKNKCDPIAYLYVPV